MRKISYLFLWAALDTLAKYRIKPSPAPPFEMFFPLIHSEFSWLKLKSSCSAFFVKSLLNWNLDCNVTTGVRGKKWKHESIDEDDRVAPLEKVVNIRIPLPLKKQLLDDNECITQLDQLVKLPRSPSVHELLKKYHDFKMKDCKTVDTVAEIVKGLCHYFDKALPTVLLYENERQQHKEVIVDNISPSSVYGAEHLLRLFVKLPEMLTDLHMEMETLTKLCQISQDLLRFLQMNQTSFFLSNYQTSEGLAPTVKDEDT
ncbi:protein MRG1-like isoform X4 [Primulina eburnea]|uniref:protein MRG1-like isoform X4 n=1 Tax=Primulina eburnea TaxID=1245227 RepID=UPI003C6CA022